DGIRDFHVTGVQTCALPISHNHQLDLELTAAILARGDFTYYGLIGSQSKRAKFEHRLRDRGFKPETVQRMRCPMGIAEVKGKLRSEERRVGQARSAGGA